MKVFEDIVDKYGPDTNFLILESDIIPQPNCLTIIENQMQKITKQPFDFLHVGNGGNDNFLPTLFGHTIQDGDIVYPCPSARCAEAMIWSYDGANKYLAMKHTPVLHPLDFYFNIIAANGVSSFEDVKTFWGHPVAFVQGSGNGTYKSTVCDDVSVPNRLKPYKPQLNINIKKNLHHFDGFIKALLKFCIPELQVTHYPNRKHDLLVTDTHPNNESAPYILINNEPQKRSGHLIQISNTLTFEPDVFFIPEVCLSKHVWKLDQHYIRPPFEIQSFSSWFNFTNTNNKRLTYFINKLRTHPHSNGKAIFKICVEDEYHPGSISDKILEAYIEGSIPVYWGCNVIVNALFNPSTMVNVTHFKNEDECYSYLIHCCTNPDILAQFFAEPFLNNNGQFFDWTRNSCPAWLQNLVESLKSKLE
jgi:hypothetical protein